MTKIENLQAQLETLKNTAKDLQVAKDIQDALVNIEDLKAQIKMQEALEKDEADALENGIKNEGVVKMDATKVTNIANVIKAMDKIGKGIALTEVENKLVDPYRIQDAINGEKLILPTEIVTTIREILKEEKNLSTLFDFKNATTLTGSFVMDASVIAELKPLVDGVLMSDDTDLKFVQKSFSLQEYGGLIFLTDTTLKFSDADLINHVSRIFARRYLATVNRICLEKLALGKTKKAFTDIKSVIKASNTVLDPMAKGRAVVVTNQDGFQMLLESENGQGVSFIQPDLTKPAFMQINGMQVHVFSNSQMPTKAKKIPLIMGDLKTAMIFVEANNYEVTSDKSAGFLYNALPIKIKCYIDCIQVTDADEFYVYGELTQA